jgi:hypothetical protein
MATIENDSYAVAPAGPDRSALVAHRAATDAAGVCREIVLKTAQTIQNRRYVRVEGWQAIANAFGAVASAVDVRRVDGGIAATGQVRRVSDGAILATAEGFVGDDEKTWSGRNEFARRAMAQTRAISRACRSAFAFVVVLMDAGLETTPAEEMGDFHDKPNIEYRPKPEPANRERRAVKATAISSGEAFIKAIDAAGKAEDLNELDVVRRKVDASYHSERLTDNEYRDVLGAIEARKSALSNGGAV